MNYVIMYNYDCLIIKISGKKLYDGITLFLCRKINWFEYKYYPWKYNVSLKVSKKSQNKFYLLIETKTKKRLPLPWLSRYYILNVSCHDILYFTSN